MRSEHDNNLGCFKWEGAGKRFYNFNSINFDHSFQTKKLFYCFVFNTKKNH